MTNDVRTKSEGPSTNLQRGRERSKRFLGIGLAFLIVFAVIYVTTDQNRGAALETIAFVAFFTWVTCWLWAGHIWIRFREDCVEDAIAATGGADGRRLLYLRSFDHDDERILLKGGVAPFPNPLRMFTTLMGSLRLIHLLVMGCRTWEEILEVAARRVGPVVAIGEPGESLPTLGLMNEYVGDDWRERVVELAKASELTVVRTGLSASVAWEMEMVVRVVEPARLVVYVGRRSKRFADRRKKRRREYYAEFRNRCGHLFPKGLPETMGRRWFILFEADWTPIAYRRRWRGVRPPPNVRVANYMDSVLSAI